MQSFDVYPLDEVKAMQEYISFGVTRTTFEYEFDDNFAATIDSIMAEIEAADPSDLRELTEPSDDWDDSTCTEPPEEDGDYYEEDDGL
ncbi:hypothetical protein ASG42_11200 [Rhizobium sp. Leaf391]|uniref:hypothetical protein n=1 Tax=Rhizobium sp. Leaf391 TaxID=1736360 RepID=UPI000713911E|nr:hypothetical protein [Rhizobium sp. Leaf391]KQS91050.1 hypothetical protein ASG42_11200 [Rhizobium sp. Leaf391]